jgi:DNA-binding response OmpR family regulator
MERILVIEDDRALRKSLARLFSSEGYEVDVVPDAVSGLERLRHCVPAAAVIDLPRPGSSGCDLCKKIANLVSGVPLLILSGSSDVADKVLLLEMGADDYVTVPFIPRELVARLRALIRRASRVSPEPVYVFADVLVDFFKDGNYAWRREDHGHCKGIQDTGVFDKERRTHDLAGRTSR